MRLQCAYKRVVFVALALVAGAFLGAGMARGEEVTIAITGQAYGALYPCNCPDHREGGVSRRGQAIKDLRREYPQLLVVEAGMSFASGSEDASSQNAPQDMRRTEVYLAALQTMGVDALLISGQEFVFGADFLNRFKDLPFVSSNCEGAGVPFILKKVGSVTVGIIGLTDVSARSRGALSWRAPQQVLRESVKMLRKKSANLIVVLSALSPEEDEALLKDAPGVDVVINGSPNYNSVVLGSVNGAGWIRTAWQAKKIGVLTVDVSGTKVKCKNFKEVALGTDIADDPAAKALVPVCFRDSDCAPMSGLAPRCENGGTPKAECLFTELPLIPVTVVIPRPCRTCHVEVVIEDLQKILGRVKPSYVFEDTPQAQELIKTLGLKMLPAYVADETIEKHVSFPYVSRIFSKSGALYVLKPEVAGVSYFIGRKPAPRQLDVFFDFTYPTLGNLCDRLLEFQSLHPDVTVRFHFLAAWDETGGFKLRPGSSPWDVDEFKRAACVNAFYPDTFLRYIECRSVKKDPSLWESCAAETGIDVDRIKTCAASDEGEKLFKERIRLTKEMQIATGPTFLIDNTEVFGVVGVPSLQELEKAVLGEKAPKQSQ